MKQCCVGIDIGGTTVKCGLFTLEGELLDKWEVPTRKDDSGQHILPDVAKKLKEKLAAHGLTADGLKGIGMGVPGPVMPDGRVEVCVNLGWHDCWPAREMQKLMGAEIRCEAANDANVAALGEMWQGGGKGCSNVVAVTLGTGVGGGVVIIGHVIAGVHGLGGELGHIHVRDEEKEFCNCGGRGCLEQVASATGIAREARRNMAAGTQPSALRKFGDRVTAKNVCDCAKDGDAMAMETLDTACRYLGLAMAYVTHIVDPEIFVIGGGVSRAGKILTDLTMKHYEEFTPVSKKKAGIVLASLGNDAGIYGAARMVLD